MPFVDRHKPGTPSWMDLMTTDVEKARAFYGAIMGWEFAIGPAETGFYSMAMVSGKPVAGIGQMQKDSKFPPSWTVYFEVESADKTAATVREFGGQVVMEPMDVMQEGRMAICADNNGAIFGVWQPRNHTGAKLVDQPGAMCWHEVNVWDAGKARAFYGAVFQLEAKKMDNMDYWTLHLSPEPRTGILQMDHHWPKEVPAHWMNYLGVKNTDESCKLITELGGKVCVPAFDTPHGRIAVVEDPMGAVFSIISGGK